MIGATLSDIREYIESLASDSGRYYLVCGRTGDRPVPADGLFFESRAIARAAARATEQYRAALRQYDPQVPSYDVIVCEDLAAGTAGDPRATSRPETDDRRPLPGSPSVPGELRGAVDFCHTVAAVVFEAIAASPHDGLEGAVMDTYFEVAETIDHPDELCLRLLESMAAELEARLEPVEQSAVLADAATALPIEADDEPEALEAVLAQLRSVGLLESAHVTRRSIDLDSAMRSWSVRLEGYALGERSERVVTLPIVVGLLARLSTRSLTITDVGRVETGQSATWELTITTSETETETDTEPPCGLACVRAGDRP